jgi:hypothetical protein
MVCAIMLSATIQKALYFIDVLTVFMPNVILLSVIVPNVIVLSVITPNVIVLSVITLNVVLVKFHFKLP